MSSNKTSLFYNTRMYAVHV